MCVAMRHTLHTPVLALSSVGNTQATNINGQTEHLQMKYVGTGHADIQKQ